jgi:hypothetical protein
MLPTPEAKCNLREEEGRVGRSDWRFIEATLVEALPDPTRCHISLTQTHTGHRSDTAGNHDTVFPSRVFLLHAVDPPEYCEDIRMLTHPYTLALPFVRRPTKYCTVIDL